ncbi:energy-coupling factor transport system ATP-binding protein [Ruminiclostridium sufflavum DSM 19573]|uniref:Energy-coupling factor transport system ATP-binding protein n=1 Tax=Ruminiclostridium sufflavum DSM 19573 TaxID=1121337 RepID=A0A318XM67_9FIRM|nr:ATP-binding cassette domain-containing protein [Ruminiclostridium sufflavum]PYG87648.1 energy-coupling factor transport system ATP-binding protein [Ruminiclostridium sufflavum DSM 19573]
MIEFKDFSFKYKESENFALSGVSLSIQKGDFVGIIGNSGAGKSTFTYALNGIIPHHFEGDFYGEVNVNGLDTVEASPSQLALTVGSVFQDIDGQMVSSVVEDELLFGLENFGVPHDRIESRMVEMLAMVGIEDLRYRNISTLSGGQKQKVAIAAVAALMPDILVLDEPTAELDPQSSLQIFNMLRMLNEKMGITIIVVEQKIMLLSEFSKRLMIINEGRIFLDGTPQEVLKDTGLLRNIGVNCPRVATLAGRLIEKNLYKGDVPVNIGEAEIMVKRIIY